MGRPRNWSAEKPKTLTTELKEYVLHEGSDLVGIAAAGNLNRLAPRGHRPSDFLPTARSVIVMAVHLIDGVIDGLPKSWREFNCNYFESTDFINNLGFKVARFLERKGYRSYPLSYGSRYGIEPESFSHRYAAVEAGFGEVGLNNLLITPKYGPRIRVTVILTEARLECDKRFEGKICDGEKCGYKCVYNCPANAVSMDGKINYKKCIDHHKSLPVLKIGDSMRCGLCMAACPKPEKLLTKGSHIS
jgi:epoxyqueuosine reductase QueG